MKKNLFYLFMLICSVSFFTACDKDDKEPDYSGTYTGKELAVKLNGIPQLDKTIVLSSTEITLNEIVAGEQTLKLPVVFTGATFAGSSETADRKVSVEGNIVNDSLTVNVSLTLTNALVGTWNIFEGNVTLKMEAPAGTEVVFFGNKIPAESFQMLMPMLMGSIPQAYLKDVTFQANGFVVANYDGNGNAGKGDSWVKSPEGAVKWYVKDGMVYLLPDLAIMMPQSKATSNPLEDMLTNGMPMHFTIDGDALNVYVTKEQMLPTMDIIIALLEGMDTSGNAMLEMMKPAIPEMKVIMEQSTVFDLGMNLKK
ncbi:MAG: hypothetical protein RR202_07975 [Bacteroidales bacterium]